MTAVPYSVGLLHGTPRRGLNRLRFKLEPHDTRIRTRTSTSTSTSIVTSASGARLLLHHHYHYHHNRRSVTALALGIPPQSVAAWTGRAHHRRWLHTTGEASHANTTSPDELPAGTSPLTQNYEAALDALYGALRQEDVLKLYFCLMDLTRGAREDDEAFRNAMADIPFTTFSEILRCLDPFTVSEKVDSAPDLYISYGAAKYTSLGDLVNKWGIKVLYVRIFNRLRLIHAARLASGIRPLLNDYVVFMRCAAATADIQAVKTVWWAINHDGYIEWSHAGLWAEFIKARYLAESLYANNDQARYLLRPLDMHRSSLMLPPDVIRKLRNLRATITHKRNHRFGQNPHERYFAEPLTRTLRKMTPLQKLKNSANFLGYLPEEELSICAAIKANGRCGDLGSTNGLLYRCWNITVEIDHETGEFHLDGGIQCPSGSSQAATPALLDAVVHGYCGLGYVALALTLVKYISKVFDMAVPNKVWSDLLNYAHVMCSKPADTEWSIAGIPGTAVNANFVLDIWETATQDPHDFKPSVSDYYHFAKCLVVRGRAMGKPVRVILQLKQMHDEIAQQLEEAWLELVQTTRQKVPNLAAYRRYRVLQSTKSWSWYCFRESARQVLTNTIPTEIDDYTAARLIPRLVNELRLFLPGKITYRTATGVVELSLDDVEDVLEQSRRQEDVPMTLHERPPYVEPERGNEEQEQDDEPAHELASGGSLDVIDSLSTLMQRNRKPRFLKFKKEIIKPAHKLRPLYNAPQGQISTIALQEQGRVFTGFHDHKSKRAFAARKAVKVVSRAVPTPVNLGRDQSMYEWVKQLLAVRA